MNIQIKATNMELTQEIADYVNKKMADLDRFMAPNDPASVHVYFEVERTTDHHQTGDDLFRAEANLTIDGASLYADARGAQIFAAIDLVKDEITRQIKEKNEKQRTLLKKGGAALKKLLRGFRK